MKLKFLFFCCLTFFCRTAFATDFLAENNGYLLHFFAQSGTPSHLYMHCEKDILTPNSNKTLHFKLGGDLNWYNVRAKFAGCWYIFSFGKFDLEYKLFYKEKGGSFKEATRGTFYYIDQDIENHIAKQLERTRTIAFVKNKPFEHQFTWDFPANSKPGIYEFKLELRVRPSLIEPTSSPQVGSHYEVGSEHIFCPYESAMDYINGNKGWVEHIVSCSTNKSGGKIYLLYQNSKKTIHFGSDLSNPKNREGYRLVYNHPNAEFPISLAVENAHADTIIDGSDFKGYNLFLAGIGDAYQLPVYNRIINDYKQCIDKQVSCNHEFPHFFYIHYEHPEFNKYLQKQYSKHIFQNGNYNSHDAYGLIHLRPILLHSYNPQNIQWNDVAISDLSSFKAENNTWFTRVYHLRDLDLVKLPQVEIKENTTFKVWNQQIYTNNSFWDVSRATGCTAYGPGSEYIQKTIALEDNYPYHFKGENCILYKIVPAATLKACPPHATATQRICINREKNPALFTPQDFIHLQGQEISCGQFSPTVYRPRYKWQFSEDKVKWENIDADNPYIVDRSILPYTLIMDEDKDLLLNTAFLNPGKTMYFRQICILEAFASNEESDLYNFCQTINGQKQYFISIYGKDYYSYQPLPSPKEDNFNWVDKDWTYSTQLCPQEQLGKAQLKFALQQGDSWSQEELNTALSYANYKIYHINTEGIKTLVSTLNHYEIPDTLTKTCEYECVIQICKDSITKKTKILKYPPVKFNLCAIQSQAAILKIDSLNQTLHLRGLRKMNTLYFNDTEIGTRFLMRQDIPLIKPNYYTEDWSLLSKNECIALLKERKWNFTEETGILLQQASLSQIQLYGIQKQRSENELLRQTAIQDSIQNNQWHEIQDGNAQMAMLVPSQQEKDVYYFKKVSSNGCESDPLKIWIEYCPMITGNVLKFKGLEKDTLYAIMGLGNPMIVGSYPVSGGYGSANAENKTSYTYQWMRKSNNENWEPIVVNYHLAAVTDSGTKVMNSDTKYISLTENTLKKLDGNYEIARFVHSRINNDLTSQITSISNSIYIVTVDSLSIESVNIDQEKCPTEEIDITIKEPNNVLNEHTTYIWDFSSSKIEYEIMSTGYGKQNNRCIIKNAKKNFNVYVKRYDYQKNLESNRLTIPFDISSQNSRFSIVFDNRKYQLEDTLVVNVGSKIQLINESKDAEKCKNTWTLQIQDNYLGDHQKVMGTQSNKVHTNCYLYNLGANPIQLSTIWPNGCKSTVTAQHIWVEGIENRALFSYFEEAMTPVDFNNYVEVYPTYLSAENQSNLYISTNLPYYTVCLYNAIGQTILPHHQQEGSTSYSLGHLLPGLYILQINEQQYKIIKQ